MNCRSASGRGRSIRHLFTIEDRVGRTVSNRYKPSFLTSFLASFLIAVVSLTAPSLYAAHGGTPNGICMVDRFNATKTAKVEKLQCSASDVNLAIYEVVTGPSSCIAGETILVSLKGDFTSGSKVRLDMGAFISQNGGTPNALGGSCYSDYLHPASVDNNDLNLSGGAGPYYNGEIPAAGAVLLDRCGDLRQDEDATFITGVFSIPCQDADGDFRADVRSCTVWDNSVDDTCQDEGDVTAETTSKCDCGLVNISGIEVRESGYIEVVKDLVPTNDLGRFNLQIDAANKATDVGDGGTTSPVEVTAGTSGNPDDTHTVGETAVAGTDLALYTTTISCVDRGEDDFNDTGSPLTQSGPRTS